ncbi:MAG: S8 family serine peptidase, partial [Leptolyngbyaceae bacterium]|nr:S8 family serine peptidase [Leptolyngbyaceae bacterium]
DWNAALIEADAVWKREKGDRATVAVLDTGIDINHQEFGQGVVVKRKDFTGEGLRIVNDHGTHCAGTVGARKLVDGIAPACKLIDAKVLSGADGSGEFSWLANGIRWAVDEGADVLSISIGTGPIALPPTQFSPDVRKALEYALGKGVIVCIAAGNEGPGPNTTGYPARFAEVLPDLIIVAACDRDRNIATFSSRGKAVNITAPGVAIRAPISGNRYAEWDGTSMATPHIAGIAALYASAKKKAGQKPDPKEFRELLTKNASTRNPSPPSPASGWGLAQADKVVPTGAPISPPPVQGKPYSAVIEYSDLTPAKQAELKKSGITKFRLEIGHEETWSNQYRPAPIQARARGYNECRTAVEAGRRVTLAVGVSAAADYSTPSLAGIAPGVYECWQEGGRELMRLVTPPAPVYVPGPCPGGFCPVR